MFNLFDRPQDPIADMRRQQERAGKAAAPSPHFESAPAKPPGPRPTNAKHDPDGWRRQLLALLRELQQEGERRRSQPPVPAAKPQRSLAYWIVFTIVVVVALRLLSGLLFR